MVGRALLTVDRQEIQSLCRPLDGIVFTLKFESLSNNTSKLLILVVIVSWQVENNETTQNTLPKEFNTSIRCK